MQGMVVCPEPLAAEAGAWALKKGGNAVDATIAGAFAQGVVDPKMCGIGGHGRMMIYQKKQGELIFVDFMSHCGSKAVPGVFEPVKEESTEVLRGYKVKSDENSVGYKAFTVPGFVAGVGEAHQRFGRLPWRDVLSPAIKLAEDGFAIYPYLVKMGYNDAGLAQVSTNKACADIFTKNGHPYAVGEMLVQKDLGRTLRRLAEKGPNDFYRGELAQEIGKDIENNGALVTLKDLNEFRLHSDKEPWIAKPLSTTYGEYEVFSDQPPGSGPMKLEALNILENFELRKFGWNTPEYLNIVSQAMQLAMIDREKFMRDPILYPDVRESAAMMISKKHAAKQKEEIAIGEGNPAKSAKPSSGGGTTHISALDGEGNAAASTHSVYTSCGVVTPGLGFMYNSHNHAFDPRPGSRVSLEPGKMPVVYPSPTMMFKGGELFMVTGSPAGPRGATGEIQAFLNVVEFNMTMQQAVSVPRIFSDIHRRQIVVESNFPFPYPQKELERLGNKIVVDDYTGRLATIKIDLKTKRVEGGTDPRGGGGLALVE